MIHVTENDRLRTTFKGGTLFISEGVWSLGLTFVEHALNEVKNFQRFSDDDIRGDHEFGRFSIEGRQLVWKIECNPDRDELEHIVPPKMFTRTLLVMLAEEY